MLKAVACEMAPAAFVHPFEHSCDCGLPAIKPLEVEVSNAVFDDFNLGDSPSEGTIARRVRLRYGKDFGRR